MHTIGVHPQRLAREGFGPLTARNYDEYLLKTCLQRSATKYLTALSEADRTA
ncbi:hypothetical protein [Streptomyces sp. NPDC059894]|uniref:hypothetical protein n=1 Tax=unclassified Streptomyces TaxID=2593676 RepID=UPI0036528B7B